MRVRSTVLGAVTVLCMLSQAAPVLAATRPRSALGVDDAARKRRSGIRVIARHRAQAPTASPPSSARHPHATDTRDGASAAAESDASAASPAQAAPSATTPGADVTLAEMPDPGGPSPRVLPGIGTTPDGATAVLYGGGISEGGGDPEPLADTWTYTQGRWTPRCGTATPGADAPCGPGPRGSVQVAAGPEGVVLFGGMDRSFLGSGPPGVLHGDTWVWNGARWTQICATGTCGPDARVGAAMAGNSAMTLLAFGITGFDGAGDPSAVADDTWAFDGRTWTQLCGSSVGSSCGLEGRVGATMSWDGTGFVLFGGMGPDPEVATWVWTGSSWQQVCATDCGPGGRVFASMAFLDGDRQHRGAILVGGMQPTEGGALVLGDAWFWRAGAWTEIATPWPDAVAIGSDDPRVLDALLFSVATGLPAECSAVVVGSGVDVSTSPPSFVPETWTASTGSPCRGDGGGRSRGGEARGSASGAAAATVLPVTGSDGAFRLFALAVSLLLAGAAALGLSNLQRPASRRSSEP